MRREDEVTPSGVVIHWSAPRTERRVSVTYSCCRKTVTRAVSEVARFRRPQPVACRTCKDQRLDRSASWRGGVGGDGRGYRLLLVAALCVKDQELALPMVYRNGYCFEHRLIVARRLGRPLLPTEIVHHDNDNTLDNSDANLVLFSRREHMSLHRRKIGGAKGC